MARWFVDRLPQRGVPSVSLRRLLPDARVHRVCGLESLWLRRRPSSARTRPAIRCRREARAGYDGHHFVHQALERGAAGVIVERPCPEAGRLQVIVPNAIAAHARICHALAGDPSHQLVTMGVTGSFGKTMTALMVRRLLTQPAIDVVLSARSGFCDGSTTRPVGAGFDPVMAGMVSCRRKRPGHGSPALRS